MKFEMKKITLDILIPKVQKNLQQVNSHSMVEWVVNNGKEI